MSDYADIDREFQAYQDRIADLEARIEALEFEVEHERYNVEKTAQEAAKRIKALEAALRKHACGECHLQPGEVCDICGRQAALAPEPNK